MNNSKSLIAINVSVFLIMLGVGMIVALLPQRIINLSGSVSVVGLLASVFAVTYVLAQIPKTRGRFSRLVRYFTFVASCSIMLSAKKYVK